MSFNGTNRQLDRRFDVTKVSFYSISVVESNSNTGSKKNAIKSMRDKEKIDVFRTLI